MDKLIYGAAYYDEYMPYDRLEKDIDMMKKAGINTVRIAESTWSTCEPQPGVFDFSHVERVIDAMEKNGIDVIVGTPTYAIPTWMAKSYPDVIATTIKGKGIYGARQIMDITNPVYLFYAERIIRKLMECTAHRKCVIGFQVDNETKYYGTAGKNVQRQFIKYLRKKFNDDLEKINDEFGLSYWSNRINSWEDFPDIRGTINGSLGAEFEKFQRTLVDDFLSWQASIVNEYKRDDQFVTHNFDFEWRGYSFGIQPDVNHFKASKCLTIAGTDIYHPTQDELTGEEIAFGGDVTRSLKNDNYLVLETEAQGFPGWTPYDGQLRLQAYSHIASGANSVMYWHWHSIHNSFETYWKGVLSHDLKENCIYKEVQKVGHEWSEIGSNIVNLVKKNKVAILVSNEALTALKWFKIDTTAAGPGKLEYNDVLRWIYNRLYRMNIECDFISPECERKFEDYNLIVIPALYAVPENLLIRLNDYTKQGGHLIVTFKSAFANEYVKVSQEIQPNIINNCLGVTYQQFTFPKSVKLKSDIFNVDGKERNVLNFMELLTPTTAEILASYEHPAWSKYAAITGNNYGKGYAIYIGCMTSEKMLDEILKYILNKSQLIEEVEEYSFPIIIRKGKNTKGNTVYFYLNYSFEEQHVNYNHSIGKNLLTKEQVIEGKELIIKPWDLQIIEEGLID